jgi:hypothetical protein
MTHGKGRDFKKQPLVNTDDLKDGQRVSFHVDASFNLTKLRQKSSAVVVRGGKSLGTFSRAHHVISPALE